MNIRDLIPFGRKNIEVIRKDGNPFAAMQREINSIFDAFNSTWGISAVPSFAGSFMPRLDLTEDAKAVIVTAELPGMSEKDIDLSISGDMLTIKGEKRDEKEDRSKDYFYSERSYGSFMRSVPLPREVDADKVSASFKKGVLTVIIPKTTADTSKKIAVKTG